MGFVLVDYLLLKHELVGTSSHREHDQGHHQAVGQNMPSCILVVAGQQWEGKDRVDALESGSIDEVGDNTVTDDRKVEYAREVSDAYETKENGWEDEQKVSFHEQDIDD